MDEHWTRRIRYREQTRASLRCARRCSAWSSARLLGEAGSEKQIRRGVTDSRERGMRNMLGMHWQGRKALTASGLRRARRAGLASIGEVHRSCMVISVHKHRIRLISDSIAAATDARRAHRDRHRRHRFRLLQQLLCKRRSRPVWYRGYNPTAPICTSTRRQTGHRLVRAVADSMM